MISPKNYTNLLFMTQSHTYDFGIVGNCAFMASIDKRTNVVWMCWPSFDSSFVFGSLLDSKKGGEFTILPVETAFSSHQYYMDNTNILVTEIEDENGKYRVTDFAPRFPQYDRYFRPLMLIRKVEPLSGNPRVNVRCAPKGDYGTKNPERVLGSNHIKYLGIGDEMRLTTNIPLSYVIDDEEPFFLNETKYLVLTYGAPLEAALEKTADEFLRATQKYWQDWVKSTSIGSFHQKAVIRSALALKIHQFEDTGAIIAASTTSLPESPAVAVTGIIVFAGCGILSTPCRLLTILVTLKNRKGILTISPIFLQRKRIVFNPCTASRGNLSWRKRLLIWKDTSEMVL